MGLSGQEAYIVTAAFVSLLLVGAGLSMTIFALHRRDQGRTYAVRLLVGIVVLALGCTLVASL